MLTDKLKKEIKKLPQASGVYKFLDSKGTPIYIGKAINLHSRVSHYQKSPDSRIRAMVIESYKLDFEETVNQAVTTTLSRSINNSMTIIFMLLALFLLGGATIRWFVLALLIGTISGTYSSTFTAAPLLVVWERVAHKTKSV